MSVLLTAGKNSIKAKPKSAAPKKKKKVHHAVDQGASRCPPVSNDKTLVWHWEFYGDVLTMMFDKRTNEVWCNGEVLETIEKFGEDDGSIIDFYLTLENDSAHRGRLTRRSGMAYDLIVDGYVIAERVRPDQRMQVLPPPSHIPAAAVYQEPPPAYEQVVRNDKKYK